jgi:ABC-2 type transport system ATP-binding protein
MLSLQHLVRSFGEVVAVDDVSFDVPAGRIVGFVGRNGAGKTTTMRIVLGVLEPERGEVRFRDRPVDHGTRLRFGYMPEERGLYPKMRVRDQLVYLARLSGLDRVDAAANTDVWLDRLEVDGELDGPVEELSLGNQQRVQLAAALVHRPELLVLDEPFSGLDPVGVDVLLDVLRDEAAAGVGIVFSSHQLDLVERVCDEVVIIDHGRIKDHGPLGHDPLGDRFRRAVAT